MPRLSSGVTTDATQYSAALPAQLRERWRDASARSVWRRPADWYHPAVDELAHALLTDGDATAAAETLGRARGHDGVGIGETIDDLACLYRTAGAHEPPLEALRAMSEGWADGQAVRPTAGSIVDPESGLPTAQYLGVRLAETYQDLGDDADGGRDAGRLLVVDVAVEGADVFTRGLRACAVGEALGETFGRGHPMAALGGGVYCVLTPPGRSLGEPMERVRDEIAWRVARLEVADLTRYPVRLWVEQLPQDHPAAVTLVQRLARP